VSTEGPAEEHRSVGGRLHFGHAAVTNVKLNVCIAELAKNRERVEYVPCKSIVRGSEEDLRLLFCIPQLEEHLFADWTIGDRLCGSALRKNAKF